MFIHEFFVRYLIMKKRLRSEPDVKFGAWKEMKCLDEEIALCDRSEER